MSSDNFIFFWGGEYSQWYKSPFEIDGMVFNTCEQWMMWNKAIIFDDLEIADLIMSTKDPKNQKALGRKVKNFNPRVWNSVSRPIVFRGNLEKFTQNDNLYQKIINEDPNKIFVEASPFDKIWGIGLAEDNPLAHDMTTWNGTNWLGYEITKVFKILTKRSV